MGTLRAVNPIEEIGPEPDQPGQRSGEPPDQLGMLSGWLMFYTRALMSLSVLLLGRTPDTSHLTATLDKRIVLVAVNVLLIAGRAKRLNA